MSLIMAKNKPDKQLSHYGLPSLMYDSTGIDKTFCELLKEIKSAHQESNVSYPLEFIHLGHDEPAYWTRLLIGDCKLGPDPKGWNVVKVLETCKIDKDFINNYSGSTSEAVQTMVIKELLRRINQVKYFFKEPMAKILIYGDAWDPQKNGRLEMETWNGSKCKMIPDIAALPCLNDHHKKYFKENIILMPWNYSITDDPDGDGAYNAPKSFKYFSKNDFKFIYVHEIISCTNKNKYKRSNPSGYPQNRIDQAVDYYNAAKKFKNNCLGYNAIMWGRWQHPAPKCFDSVEYLFKLNENELPPKDYN
jgi:hypothetical protein